jgi:hypothetical protein
MISPVPADTWLQVGWKSDVKRELDPLLDLLNLSNPVISEIWVCPWRRQVRSQGGTAGMNLMGHGWDSNNSQFSIKNNILQ